MAQASTPRPWAEAWHNALYGSAGFYRRPEGPSAHFSTSAAGIPHATELLASALITMADRHHLDTVVDFAAGAGQLINAIAAAAPHLRCVGVDITTRPESLAESIAWWQTTGGASLPDQLTGLDRGLVIAHEWLDVVPCTVAERDNTGAWRAALVHESGETSWGQLVAGNDLDWLARWVPTHVHRAEVGRARDDAWSALCSSVSDGLVLAIDYGHERANRPTHGTLTGFRAGREVAPQLDGSTDITAHVAVDSLAQESRSRQREALADLLPDISAPPIALASTQPQAYLKALARHSALATLRAPGGLGEFWWVQRRVQR